LKNIIFDMDGVIVDSEYTYLESKTKIINDAGFDKPISYQYQFMGTTYEYMWQTMKEELGLPKEVNFYIAEMNRLREEMIKKNGVLEIKNVKDVLYDFKNKNYRLAVASSSPKEEIIRNLTELEIINYFEFMVSGEEVDQSKPSPDIFLKTAELLEVSPNKCIVIEDTTNGVKAAKNAGMYCIGFKNPDYPKQDLELADQIVSNLMDITIPNYI